MTISFQPISGCAGTQPFAECCGIDLGDGLPDAAVSKIRQGLLEHGLLLFRNQTLSPDQEVAFNRAFGWHDPAQREYLFGFGAPVSEHRVSGAAQMPALPEVSVLGNVTLQDYHGIDTIRLKPVLGFTFSAWHADGLHDMHTGMPELTTMFNPPGWQTSGGGETLFTSGVRALDRMEADVRDELRHCVAAYMRSPNDQFPDESRRIASGPSYMVEEGSRRAGFGVDPDDPSRGMNDFRLTLDDADGGGRHPCIRVHPETGQESLYVTPGKVVCLLDRDSGAVRHDIEATQDLLSRALKPSVLPGIRYAHRWQAGDFVAWLNTLVLHSATDPAAIDGPRLMHRIRLSTPRDRGQFT